MEHIVNYILWLIWMVHNILYVYILVLYTLLNIQIHTYIDQTDLQNIYTSEPRSLKNLE